MTKPLNIYEAKSRLSELVDRAENGEEIIIARAGQPAARLMPLEVPERTPGAWAGQMTIADDFDAPVPEEVLSDFEREE